MERNNNFMRGVIPIDFTDDDGNIIYAGKMKLGTNELARLEDMYKMKSSELLSGEGTYEFKMIRDVLYVGLSRLDKNLEDPEQVGDLMDTTDLKYLSEQIAKAVNFLSGGKKSPQKSGPKKAAKKGIQIA